MKLSAREAAAFRDRPGDRFAAALIWGPDAGQTARWRDRLRAALSGEEAGSEMALTRIAASELRRDPWRLDEALRAAGFFGGRRIVLVEGATDAATDALAAAFAAAHPGDAFLLATAGALTGRSRLRRLFEDAREAACISVEDRPQDRAGLAAALAAEGVSADEDSLDLLAAFAIELDGAASDDLAARAALHAASRGVERIETEDVEACAPLAFAADAEAAAAGAISGRIEGLGARLRRLEAQGVSASVVVSAVTRSLRRALGAATGAGPSWPGSERGGASSDVFWPPERIEAALAVLLETERALRSSPAAGTHAVAGRALLRLAAEAHRISRRQRPSSSSSDR